MPWQHITGSVQFLKSFYRGNTKQLGAWGITITDGGKVKYPSAFAERAALFTAFAAQNDTFPAANNPLTAYLTQQKIDLAKDATLVQQALDNNTSFTHAARQSENETELRNQLWLPVLAHIKLIGNFLMKLYKNNEKALGDWGFVVDDTPKKPRMRTTKLKLGQKITTKGIVLGSSLSNIGGTALHVYKGKSHTGTPAKVPAGEQFGIQKGYSIITVVNPSALEEAIFKVIMVN